jgi:hypothetical protein
MQHATAAKESTEEVVQSLEVQEEQDYKQIEIATLVTTIVLVSAVAPLITI